MSLVTSARWLMPRQFGVVASVVAGTLLMRLRPPAPHHNGPRPNGPGLRSAPGSSWHTSLGRSPRGTGPRRVLHGTGLGLSGGRRPPIRRGHIGGRPVSVKLSDDNGAFQVVDDVDLLELMLDDLAAA